MDAVTTAYSRQAMRSILALDQRQRMQAVAVVEALVEQTMARLAAAADPMEQDARETEQDTPETQSAQDTDAPSSDEPGDEEASEITNGSDDDEVDQLSNGQDHAVATTMVPYGGNGELHLVAYGETGDLVVAIKDNAITVMALIDVMQGLKGGTDHD